MADEENGASMREDSKLKSVVPWGRSLEEYKKMFNLTEEELQQKRFIDVGGGPASFNSQLPGKVISVDPIYALTPEEIGGKIEETKAKVASFVNADASKFNWGEKTFLDTQHLIEHRCETMVRFLEDYKKTSSKDRYITGSVLAGLPFPDKSFDIALSSHFLLLYAPLLGERFHVEAVKELMRVSKEVRIFPLIDTNFSSPDATIASMHVQGKLD